MKTVRAPRPQAPVIAAAISFVGGRSSIFRMLLPAAIFCCSTSAQAQQAVPDGMVASPCDRLTIPFPESMKTFIKSIMTHEQMATLPPSPAELVAYRQANIEARKSDWADLCRYRADDQRLIGGPANGRRIVFMGDSITQYWGLDDPDFFSGGIVNRGIGGQTTPQMLLRFQADVVALKPEVVHIMAGTNDVAGNTGPNSVEDFKNNISAMVLLAKANHIKVILASIPPASTFTWKPMLKPAQQIVELNAWLKKYAAAEKLGFVDYYSALATPDGALRPALTFDGVHPNHAGYQVMEPLARKALANP